MPGRSGFEVPGLGHWLVDWSGRRSVPGRRRRRMTPFVVVVAPGKGKQNTHCQKNQSNCTKNDFHLHTLLFFVEFIEVISKVIQKMAKMPFAKSCKG